MTIYNHVVQFLILLSRIGSFHLFYIKERPVTLFSILLSIGILVLAVYLSKIIRKICAERVFPYLHIKPANEYTLSRLIHYIIISAGALFVIQIYVDLTSLAFIFGFLGVGVGFGLQNITSNFISGLILLFESPIKVGDRVSVGDVVGDIQDINIRSTTVITPDNISMIIPNSEFIENNVINWSHGDPTVRIIVHIGVAYGSDVDRVKSILMEIAEEHPDTLKSPIPRVFFTSFGDSSLDFELAVWLASPQNQKVIRSDLNFAINKAFAENTIEIPFPQRDLHLRSNTVASASLEEEFED